MKKPSSLKNLLFALSLIISGHAFSQAANNTCATATVIGTLNGNYVAYPGDLYLANQTNPTGSPCGNRYDVWYKFTLPASATTVTITVTLSPPSSLTTSNTYIELFNTSNCTINSTSTGGCNNISQPRKYTGLTAGGTYYFRVNTTVNPNTLPATNWGFNVYVMPFNDDCNNVATILNPGATLDGSLAGATNSGVAAAPCSGNPDDDVWYTFTALYSYATLTLGNIGSDLATSGARMQLFSGACGSLSSLACSGSANVINASGLTPGNIYYVRVYSAGTGQAGSNWGYRISLTPSAKVIVGSGRMKEVFHQQIISAPQVLADPWEVTYGPDNNLWVTESKGYRIYRINPTTGVRDTVLDISQGSTFLSDNSFNVQANVISNNPQGGLAGLALHPKFLDATAPQNYAYVSYIYQYNGGSSPTGIFFTNRIVQFTYNTGTGRFESPVIICDTIPGSNDHNSQRMIIAPVNGTPYLFYAAGDMGAGQFSNQNRLNKAQDSTSYEGKILRFNLTPDGDANAYQKWVPNDNPYSQSAVWCIGIRNNQGFAYDSTSGLLYGSSHGPYSDDEINIIERYKNFGHPLVIGYSADNNYNASTAGAPNTTSACPMINNEQHNADSINASVYAKYKDPLYAAYAQSQATIHNIWVTNPNNGGWPSEGWSGLDLYNNTLVPGWKNSLVASSLKWGRLVRLKLGSAGTTIVPTNGTDTVSYFGSQNRFRDLAFAPNGKDIYVVMDRSTTTSGPSALFPVVPACQGCVQKYTFLGYADASGKSSIPTAIDVTTGTSNTCNPGTTITIDNSNNNLWVPITGPDGNIMAEINANGQNLGTVTSSFYINAGAIRNKNGLHYLDRNLTITPQTQPGSPVKIRLYISKAEFDALDADPLGGVAAVTDLKILKNADPCSSAVTSATTQITPLYAEAHGANGYVLQANISGFSSFYFASTNFTLPVHLLTFTGSLQSNNTSLLKWTTTNEVNAAYFLVERSLDGSSFSGIGTVPAIGNSPDVLTYSLVDNNAANQPVTLLYYRLKMVDNDGTARYSQVITISLASITGRLTVSPNPVNGEAKVTLVATTDGFVRWQLIDNTGRIVLFNSVQVRKGNANTFYLDMKKISSGPYYLQVSGTGLDQRIKLQKL